MSLYLFRISDRAYGFKVVAVVASSEDRARAQVEAKHGGHFGDSWRRGYAELEDSCAIRAGAYAEFEFEE